MKKILKGNFFVNRSDLLIFYEVYCVYMYVYNILKIEYVYFFI